MTIYEKLRADGWKEYRDQFTYISSNFYKRFDTPTQCRCNDDKPGIQLCCMVYELGGVISYQLNLDGELSDGTWVHLANKMRVDTPIEVGLLTIPRLLATWELIANHDSPEIPNPS